MAVSPIRKGTQIRLWSDEPLRLVPKPVRGRLGFMARMFGIEVKEGFWCPQDFNRAEVGWYINHSSQPNMSHVDTITLEALRKIKSGEELTVDYEQLEAMARTTDFAHV